MTCPDYPHVVKLAALTSMIWIGFTIIGLAVWGFCGWRLPGNEDGRKD